MTRSDLSPRQRFENGDDFERRLEKKLAERRAREPADRGEAPEPTAWRQGIRYGSEFAGGVLAGAGLGYLADRFFGWSPWGLIIGVFLGFAAGALNMVRAAQSVNRAGGAEREPERED